MRKHIPKIYLEETDGKEEGRPILVYDFSKYHKQNEYYETKKRNTKG